MRLYMIRHAEPDYKNDTITPSGHLEAAALSKRLKAEGINRIYTSPLGRASDTMRYTADALSIEPVMEDWTTELTGLYVNQTVAWNVDGEVIRTTQQAISTDSWHKTPPFDQPDIYRKHEQIKRNSDLFLSRHGYEREGGKYRIVKQNEDKIAVFCHMGFGLSWISHLLEIPLPLVWSGFWLAPSSVTTILFDERSSEWAVPRCIGMGDASHLYAAGLPTSRMGIIANYY